MVEQQSSFVFPSWGGRRKGAGRPAKPRRRRAPHCRREQHRAWSPVHVTVRATRAVGSLRSKRVFGAVRSALAASSHARFRILQFSVQHDHVHLLVEADESAGLSRGCQGLAIRAAKAVNRMLGRRGQVWGDRFHARQLGTPREMRNAFAYVLQNWLKHVPGARGFDPRSSAAWFRGWRTPPPCPVGSSPVRSARTWLARTGWMRYGPLDIREGPRLDRIRAKEGVARYEMGE